MKVHPSSAGDVAAAQLGQGAAALASLASPVKATHAHAHAHASKPKGGKPTLFASVLAQSTTPAAAEKVVVPRSGETLTPVAGHAYSAISGGSRDGMYVNTSHNSRRGLAFVLVVKNGREYHIYGTGKDRLVVALRKPADSHTTGASNTAAPTGTPTVSAS